MKKVFDWVKHLKIILIITLHDNKMYLNITCYYNEHNKIKTKWVNYTEEVSHANMFSSVWKAIILNSYI